MKVYVADLLGDTLGLDRADFGSYMLLLFAYWRNKGPLPDDDTTLAAIARTSPGDWQASRLRLARYFQIGDGVWRHKRVDKELDSATGARNALSLAGKRGNQVRWGRSPGDTRGDSQVIAGRGKGESPGNPESESDRIYIQGPSERPVEPLPNFPRSEQEAVQKAPLTLQEQREFVIATFHKAMSRGGRDAKDVPIRNWPSFLAIEWKYAQNRKAEADRRATPAKPRAKTEAEILREVCQ